MKFWFPAIFHGMLALTAWTNGAWNCQMPQAFAQRVNSDQAYEKAVDAFKARRYDRALNILDALIKKNPQQSNAYILAGRVAYQKGDSRRAAAYFRRAGLRQVPPDAAFAWGSAFYEAGDCEESIRGYLSVPAVRPQEQDVALFFIGACSYKLGQKQKAWTALQKCDVRNLPAPLQKQRENLLRELSKPTPAPVVMPPPQPAPVIVMMPPPPPPPPPIYIAPPPPPASQATYAPPKVPMPPLPQRLGTSWNVAPRFLYVTKSSKLEYGEAGRQTLVQSSSITGAQGKVQNDWRPKYNFPFSLGMRLDTSVAQNSTKTTSVTLFRKTEDLNTILTEESVVASNSQVVTVWGEPFVWIPLVKTLALDMSYRYSANLPKGKTKDSFGEKTASVALNYNPTPYLLFKLGSALIDHFTSHGTIATDTQGYLDANATFGSFLIRGGGQYTLTDKAAGRSLNGYKERVNAGLSVSRAFGSILAELSTSVTKNTPPGSEPVLRETPFDELERVSTGITKVKGELTVPLIFESSVAIYGGVEYLDGYYDNNIPTGEQDENGNPIFVTVPIQVDQQFVGLTFKMNPLSWISLSMNFNLAFNTYAAGKQDYQTDVDINNPSQIQSSYATFQVFKTF